MNRDVRILALILLRTLKMCVAMLERWLGGQEVEGITVK